MHVSTQSDTTTVYYSAESLEFPDSSACYIVLSFLAYLIMLMTWKNAGELSHTRCLSSNLRTWNLNAPAKVKAQ